MFILLVAFLTSSVTWQLTETTMTMATLKTTATESTTLETMVNSSTAKVHLLRPCKIVSLENESNIPMFMKDDDVIPSLVRTIRLAGDDDHDCLLPTDNILSILRNETLTNLRAENVSVECLNSERIHVQKAKSWNSSSVIGYLTICNCTLSIEDLENLLSAFRIFVLTLTNSDFVFANQTQCVGLSKISSLHITANRPEILDLFKCSKSFPNIGEIYLKNILSLEIPEHFRTKFPNLQLLSVSNCSLTIIPGSFPWTIETLPLPLNLSRTASYNDIMAQTYPLDLNQFKREFILTSCGLRNISSHVFHGPLSLIDLSSNEIHEIGHAFSNVTNLTALKLSKNKIVTIPCSMLQNLTRLISLYLDNNDLAEISNCAFKYLETLHYLDLSNNKIRAIEDTAFAKLKMLRILRLDHNHISHLQQSTFPTGSINLQEISLQVNNVTTVPSFIFLIRSLRFVDLSHNSITMNDFNSTLHGINSYLLGNSVKNIKAEDKEIRLKHNKIRRPFYVHRITDKLRDVLNTILTSFTIYLHENPLNCDCQIQDIIAQGKYIKFSEDWICKYPNDLKQKRLTEIKKEQLFCNSSDIGLPKILSCPEKCACKVSLVDTTVVVIDCRDKNLFRFEGELPNNTRQLWLSGNKIADFSIPENSRSTIEILDLSNNSLTSVKNLHLEQMIRLQILNIASNSIKHLPETFKQLQANKVLISHNPYICDCKSLWLKSWLLQNRNRTEDWDQVLCSTNTVFKSIVEVPDDDFVCAFNVETINIVIISAFVLLFILAVLVYVHRVRCKIFLYIYFGLHPFDNDTYADNERRNIDCVVLHSERCSKWVMTHVVSVLETQHYTVVDSARDFVVGVTFIENLTKAVNGSKRIILVLADEQDTRDARIKLGWTLAMENIKNNQSNFAIIVSRGGQSWTLDDKNLYRFIKAGRFVDFSQSFCAKELMYYMPSKKAASRVKQHVNNEMQQLLQKYDKKYYSSLDFLSTVELADTVAPFTKFSQNMYHAFIFYGESDYVYVMGYLRPLLEGNGLNLCIPDRDLRPGRRLTKDVIGAIHSSLRTIIVMSLSAILDDITSMVFIEAHRKSLRDKMNHLLVIIREDVPVGELSSELRTYLRSYVSLNTDDPFFETRLITSLEEIQTATFFRKDLDEAFIEETGT